jgi:phospholipid/cholesterol/gamma-HCH transport system substrate-binding protein
VRRRQTIAQLIVFGLISVVIIAFTVFDLLDVHLTSSPYTVTVQLEQAGGIYDGAEVAYRGVQVGTVSSMTLHTSGVTITLEIDHGVKVPDNAIAHIYDLSAVGEQYVDLTPTGPSSSYLHAGSVIPAERTTTPRETASVLYDLERFVDSINPSDVQIIGREGAAAFQGTGAQLKSILSDTAQIIDQLATSADSTIDLLHNAAILLHGAAAHSGDFDTFATSLRAITTTLAQSTPILEKFLDQAAPTTRLVNRIIADNGSALTVLLGNLATLSDIQVARIPGLRSLLVAVPEFGRKAPTVVRDGALVGAANINQDQALCSTGLPLSNPISGQRSEIYAVNCGPRLVRGAANTPRPASGAGLSSGSSAPLGASAEPTATGNRQVGRYDSSTGLVSLSDGSLLRLGTNGGQDVLLGPSSWQAMLLAVTGG